VSDLDQGDRRYVVLVSMVAAIGGFLFGYDLAVVSGAIIFLQKQFHLDGYAVGFAIGSAQIGCILAPFFAGSLSDRLGRKRTLFAAALLFGLAAMGTALPRNMAEFNAFASWLALPSAWHRWFLPCTSPKSHRHRFVAAW